ncbi:histidinol dehydrogenase [Geosporobacter ferrireducens]|uniref:Histidinol dehydrogenase n=1 Tax=Geosporobacter ferrireducens TaxID=1424294 RepID=A0A1D8GQV7_9FIRM|nr:histidinol dehydrogenase [Geosporobacter ferrireducens]AOT73310.1 histidinol dehydrogenase [Geosporobacter ferrireducens]MTI55078.1 histidinol dehydrogenase [Geosporobacter ferrireducens]
MLRIISVNKDNYKIHLKELLKQRVEENIADIDETVERVILDIRKYGDKALLDYTYTFDKVVLNKVKVEEKEIQEAWDAVSKEFKDIIDAAKNNIWSYHEKQFQNSWIDYNEDIILGQKVTPIESIGMYVPGGKAAYPSTVLMNAIPAKIAGVQRLVMVTPPGKDGKVNPYILSAAKAVGVDEIYKAGGAQSIAALAYGTETIVPVNKIVGPGNIYVARAKKKVYGVVDIDMIAGPSEICILADETANPAFAAADLLSQAEHDEMASSILLTLSDGFAEKVKAAVNQQMVSLDRAQIAEQAIRNNSAIFIVEDMATAIEMVNDIAPEHLEIMTDNPFEMLPKIKNAGAIFLGHFSPEPLGDYFAGPNHTLPTSGTAKFSSPLGVEDFIKKSSVIYYSKAALGKVKNQIESFALHEGLDAHANSIKVRFLP